jgi:hypothetical protein
VISRSAAGEVTGAVQYYNFGEPTLGPFAPVTEPEVGYPTELVPEQYSTAMNFQPGVAYRLVDTRFENGVLTASWSSFDLWHEWCRLQEPHLWNVEGQGYYFCVSQDVASWAGMDEGKVALCRPLEFGPLCPGPFGRSEPCMCVVTNTTTCFGTVCRCTRDRCDADLRERVVVELTVDGEQMAGVYFSDASSFGPYEFSMERVAP